MSTHEPVLRDVLWTHPSSPYAQSIRVDLAHARSNGLEDEDAIRRIVAIARLGGVDDAEDVLILSVDEVARDSAQEETK